MILQRIMIATKKGRVWNNGKKNVPVNQVIIGYLKSPGAFTLPVSIYIFYTSGECDEIWMKL